MEKRFGKLIVSTVFGTVSMTTLFAGAQSVSLDPAKMQRIGTIDERFQSYNVEMLEVTGGKFWKPYIALLPNKRLERLHPPAILPLAWIRTCMSIVHRWISPTRVYGSWPRLLVQPT